MSMYTTGEIARLCGVSVRTVQYYDSRNILVPSQLSEGGRRLYSEEDLKRLRVICFLREADIPINSISQLLAEENPEKIITILLDQQENILRDELEEKQKWLRALSDTANGTIRGKEKIMLETYTEMLFEPEINIIRERAAFIDNLNMYMSYFYNQINGENDQVTIRYQSMIDEKNDRDVMLQQLKTNYDNTLDRDVYLKQTNTGIHREDYIFYLNDREVSKFCSQGQKRMILLALKLSIVQIIFKIKREYPILLLDDVMSELDANKRERLLRLLPETVQTVITTTDLQEMSLIDPKNVNVRRERKGMID